MRTYYVEKKPVSHIDCAMGVVVVALDVQGAVRAATEHWHAQGVEVRAEELSTVSRQNTVDRIDVAVLAQGAGR